MPIIIAAAATQASNEVENHPTAGVMVICISWIGMLVTVHGYEAENWPG